jgi:catechol 2,3-dioxygenase-like lactoylglutathione lyase family enzyme
MIDHASVPVRDLAKAGAFYESLLAPLGLTRLVVREATIGFGKSYPELWLNLRESVTPIPDPGGHICLRAPNEEAVRAFHAAALANGGADEGLPGPRQAAFTSYFGAFILDPDGNKLEAVTFPKREPG